MSEKSLLIDVSLCIGCRGCQVACKQWNMLEAEQTKQHGTYQNPQALSYRTWTIVRFNEISNNGDSGWLFAKDQCRHCPNPPPCKILCPSENAIVKESSGATVFHNENCIPCDRECSKTCPYEIPQFKGKEDKPYKCRLCYNRIAEGKETACAKACPTGAISFGDKTEVVNYAKARLKVLKTQNSNASIYPSEYHNVMWLLLEKSDSYQLAKESDASSILFAFKEILKPLGLFTLIGGLAYTAFNPSSEEGCQKDSSA